MDTGLGTAVPERSTGLASDRAFLLTSVLLFVASVVGTIYWWKTMSGSAPMPADSNMSMASVPMPEQIWLGVASTFMAMWVVMMVAMMLPSLIPTLLSYRRAVRRSNKTQLGGLTALAGVGYFFVWAVFGAVAYLIGVVLAAAQAQWMDLARLVPIATGVVVLLAGCFQLTAWKAHQLGCCRDAPALTKSLSSDAWGACQYGLRLGVRCALCCFGFMAILLVGGVMDLALMVLVASAVTLERLAPRPKTVARALGAVVIVAGTVVIAKALGMN